ncbi:MAG: hypothetical protein QXD77_02680, partial [Candidatus Aenigmatarchaeota archaeon]
MPLDKKLIQKARVKHEEKIILSLEEKGFCVSLGKDGTTTESEARDVSDFKEIIASSSVSWVDCIVDDLRTDAQKVALSLG